MQSIKFPENPDTIQPNPIQSNAWMDPIHDQLCIKQQQTFAKTLLQSGYSGNCHMCKLAVVCEFQLQLAG